MADIRIADLTVPEFEKLVREIVEGAVEDVLGDPDEGLELRDDFAAKLRLSCAEVEAGGKTKSLSDVVAGLDLSE